MQDVHPGPAGETGQQLLLAANPLDAVAGVDGNGDRGDELRPRSAGLARRLAVDEGREARGGRGRGDECRDQLPRHDLHPPGLPGDEEDEVEAHVPHRHGAARLAAGIVER